MKEKEPTENFYEGIRELIEASERIYRLAEQEYTPMVNSLIQNECKDSQRIERLLDNLLSCACDEKILILFKKLCRYYYQINPDATAYYVDAYRKMWDDDENVD